MFFFNLLYPEAEKWACVMTWQEETFSHITGDLGEMQKKTL